jgi:hypothetical protein
MASSELGVGMQIEQKTHSSCLPGTNLGMTKHTYMGIHLNFFLVQLKSLAHGNGKFTMRDTWAVWLLWFKCGSSLFICWYWIQCGSVEVVEPLRGEAWWEVIKSLGTCPLGRLMPGSDSELVTARTNCCKRASLIPESLWHPVLPCDYVHMYFCYYVVICHEAHNRN